MIAPHTRIGPYEILELLGEGGMGMVYKATDTRLDRTVAIKVLNGGADMERLEREARVIAGLSHPHIRALYDVGPDYLVMEYVDGAPIKGPMQTADAIRVALQMASALEAAHEKGVVHRDLKPGNIFVSGHGIKILDFGLAKIAEDSEVRDDEVTKTQEGGLIGTVAYMSPEQAEGRTADARSDIFSFGLVLYELLSGKRAFQAPTAIATIAAILHKPPEPLQAAPGLHSVVMQCLEKRPERRFQTMGQVREAIVGQAGGLPSRGPSIAVLPFANLSGDKENEYFSDGLAEEIINALVRIPGLKVTARTSAFSFRGKEVEIPEIGQRLGVEYVLEGSVRKAGGRIRVTAQLVKVGDGFQLWSGRYDREIIDVFAVQDEITQAIVDELKIKLSGPAAIGRRHSQNVEAYNAYLRGRYFMHRMSSENLPRAKECLETAISLDPGYALAYSSLAWHHFSYPATGVGSPRGHFSAAKTLLLKALELDDTLGEARVLLGVMRGCFDFDWAGGEQDIRRALASESISPDAYSVFGRYFLWPSRRIPEALEALEKAHELDPLDPAFVYFVGEAYFVQGRYDLALKQFRKTLAIAPGYWVAHLLTGWSYLGLDRIEEAREGFEQARRLEPKHPFVWAGFASLLAVMGKQDEAREILDRLSGAGPQPGAMICYHLGDFDRAMDLVEMGIESRDSSMFWLTSAKYFEKLWEHPRFQDVLEEMNLS